MDAARYVVDALERAGVRHVVVAPGSRSAPLVYALAEAEADGRLTTHVRIDERVAGFTALGLALGANGPVAVVTTSGTAVGNLLPAVMEANHAAVPLVVLSADRPEELRGTGANQTTIQLDLFGEHVRFATDVAAGSDPTSAVNTALTAAQGRLEGIPAGPVQVNLAFRDPLTPALDGSEWERLLPVVDAPDAALADALLMDDGGTSTAGSATGASPEEGDGAVLAGPVEPAAATNGATRPAGDFPTDSHPTTSHRTVVVAGHGAGPEAEYFARMLDLPLLAEPSSNARFGPNAIGPYRLLLEQFGPDSAAPIQRVVLFGRPTLSRQISQLLGRNDLERALFLPQPVPWFEAGRRTELVLTQWDQLVGFAGRGPDGWLQAWQQAANQAETALDDVLDGQLNGPSTARAVWATAQQDPGSILMLGSSNPVRDADLAGRPTPGIRTVGNHLTVHANRGLAGIDGTIATATGLALATGRTTRVLLGDVTFLHDSGALNIGPTEQQPRLQAIVLNDGGGGIFSVLEHGRLAEAPNYGAAVERFFGTPHTANIGALAVAFGWSHTLATTTAELAAALAAPVQGPGIVEVAAAGRGGLRELHARIAAALTN
ncbi:2-succinyl-5-enolpyruvyl-6-hydroxy-3-cyclohexene-1-carboxylic-acid synthase [Arthrobacter sp. PAMC 25486]|uniref:2-succinyl-5-enolpyruvyl-6-hydroxy-3- cyclohexene-1-carboxylic-acid synthase n=1 Tax=Arthrobacter sp. PAMC 25486 TaxID=1494608 RepID=UPI000535E2E9|nr:2-succinyl-5-enolpyruvyl-6-hydroxy-3-cyclohexene-1-carboxylic-acid synthase [Arthrobacter sp. PAMC 25486]AIY01897.1 2-succinyl-5-enolpyruvyl-6-hydroxy-3-cyclohexene-1-carboxylic-acid synthase [Arthrobacter sp. PAMC 25486]